MSLFGLSSFDGLDAGTMASLDLVSYLTPQYAAPTPMGATSDLSPMGLGRAADSQMLEAKAMSDYWSTLAENQQAQIPDIQWPDFNTMLQAWLEDNGLGGLLDGTLDLGGTFNADDFSGTGMVNPYNGIPYGPSNPMDKDSMSTYGSNKPPGITTLPSGTQQIPNYGGPIGKSTPY